MAVEKAQYSIEVVVDAADGKKQITDVETFYGKSAGRTQDDAEKLGKAISATHAKTARQQKKAFKAATAILKKEYKEQEKAQTGNLKGQVKAHNRYLAQIERLEKVHTDKMKAMRSETTMGRAKQRFKQGDKDAGGGMMGKVAGLGKAAGPVGMAVAGAFAAIGGGILVATKKADEFNASLAQLKVTLGSDISADQFKVISEQLASMPIPANIAREEIGRIASQVAGFESPDKIVETVKAITDLSRLGPDVSLDEVSAGVGTLSGALGDSQLAMDMIAQTAIALRGKAIDPLGEALSEIGTIVSKTKNLFGDSAIAVRDSASAYTALLETGVQASEATTGVEEMWLKLNDLAHDTAMQEAVFQKFPEGFDDLKERLKAGEVGVVEFIDQMQNMGDASADVAYAVGSTAGEAIGGLVNHLNESGSSMAEFSAQFDDVTGASERFAAAATTNAQAASEKLSASWDSMLISVGQGTTGFMTTMKGWAGDALGWFGDLFKSSETMAVEARGKAEESMSTFTEMGGVISAVMADIQSGDISEGTISQLREQVEAVRKSSPFAAQEMEKLMNAAGGLTQEGLIQINSLLSDTQDKMGVLAIGDQLDASQAGLEAGKDSIEGVLDAMSSAVEEQVGFWEGLGNIVSFQVGDALESANAATTAIGTSMQDQVETAEFLAAKHVEMKTALEDENLSVKEKRRLQRDLVKLETDIIKNDGAKKKLSAQMEKTLKQQFKDKKAIAKLNGDDLNVQKAMYDVGQELIAEYEAEGATLEEIERLAQNLYDTTGAQLEAEANINDYLERQGINEASTQEQRLEALQTKKGLLDAEIAGLKIAQEAYALAGQQAALEAETLSTKIAGGLVDGSITPEQAAAQRQQVALMKETARLATESSDQMSVRLTGMEAESGLLEKQISDLGGIKDSQAELVTSEQESVDLAKEKADLLSAESDQAMKLLNHRKAMGEFDGKEADFLREKSKILADQEQALVDQGAAEEDIWDIQEKRHKAEKGILDLKKAQTAEAGKQAQATGGGGGASPSAGRTTQERERKRIEAAGGQAEQTVEQGEAAIYGAKQEYQKVAAATMDIFNQQTAALASFNVLLGDMIGHGFEVVQVLASSGAEKFMEKISDEQVRYLGALGEGLDQAFTLAGTTGQLDEMNLLFKNMGDHGERLKAALEAGGDEAKASGAIVLDYYKQTKEQAELLAGAISNFKELPTEDPKKAEDTIANVKDLYSEIRTIKSDYVNMLGKQARGEENIAKRTQTLQQETNKLREEEKAAVASLVAMEAQELLPIRTKSKEQLEKATEEAAAYNALKSEYADIATVLLGKTTLTNNLEENRAFIAERLLALANAEMDLEQKRANLDAHAIRAREGNIAYEISSLERGGVEAGDIEKFTKAYAEGTADARREMEDWLNVVKGTGEDVADINERIAAEIDKVGEKYASLTANANADAQIGVENLKELHRLSGQTEESDDDLVGRNFAAEKESIELLHSLRRMTDEERIAGLRWILKAQLAELEALDKAGKFQGSNLEYMNARMKLEKELAGLGKGEEADAAAPDRTAVDRLGDLAAGIERINELWDIGKDIIEASETGGWALAEAFGAAGQGVADMAGQLTGLPLGEVYGAVAGLVDRVFDGVIKWRQEHDATRQTLIQQTEEFKNQLDLMNDLLDAEKERLKVQQLINDVIVGGADEASEQWTDLNMTAHKSLVRMNTTAKDLGLTLGGIGFSWSTDENLADMDSMVDGLQELKDDAAGLRDEAADLYAFAQDTSHDREARNAANVRANMLQAEADLYDILIAEGESYLALLPEFAPLMRARIADQQAELEHRKAMGEFEGDELAYYQGKVTNAQNLLDLATEQHANGLITIQELWDIQEAAKAANDEQAEFMTSQGAGPDFAARKQNLKLMLDLERKTEDEYREGMLTILDEQLQYIDSIKDSYATQLDYANARMEIELEIAGLMAGQNDMSDEAIAKLSELNRQRQAMILAGRGGGEVDQAAVSAVEDAIIATMTEAGASQEAIQAAIAGFSMASYDKGTAYVDSDQVARIHEGERILTSTENQDLISAVQGLASDSYLASLVSLFKSQSEAGLGYSGESGGSVFAPTINAYGSDPEETTDMMLGALQEAHSDWHEQEGTGNNR